MAPTDGALGPTPIELGPPPWSDELLERATLTNHQGVQKALHGHLGREVEGRLISLSSTLRLFNKTSEAILAQIEHHHNEVHFRNLYHRGRSKSKNIFKNNCRKACTFTRRAR